MSEIISGVVGLVGVALGYFLQRWTEVSNEQKAIKAEFTEAYSTVYYSCNVGNKYYYLSLLRRFFLRHPECLTKEANKAFFDKWLTDIAVEEGMTGGGNAWTKEKLTDLYLDLEKLKV